MTALQSTTGNESTIAGHGEGSWQLWGLTPVELHDRLWAGRGVCVVRPGTQQDVRPGARCYLLVPRADDLVLFDDDRAVRAARGGKDRAVVVEAIASCRSAYHERLDLGGGAGVRGIRRHYRPNGSARPDCLVTGDEGLARRWALGPTAPGQERAVRLTRARGRAVLYCGTHREEAVAWLGAAVEGGVNPGDALSGVRRLGPGVWGNGRSVVPATARIVGPVFVGAGVHLPAGCVVVGPAVVPDGWEPTSMVIPRAEPGEPLGERAPQRHARPWYAASKRAFDILLSLAGLAVLWPLLLGISLAILAQDGKPVLFRQRRQTMGGREFWCLKFRTMVREAEQLQEELRKANLNGADGPQFTMANDPRILPIGRWLRKTQLDELPQLWNVLKGEMSLVGPRPSPDGENQCCPPWREARLSVPAGITGLWQVRRRREPHTDFQEWIQYDIEYADRRGWRLDLCILAETARLFLPGRAKGPRS